MQIPFVDLSRQYKTIGNEIELAVKDCIDRFDFVGGLVVEEFAHQFGKYTGAAFCVPVANGTDAIELALMAMGIGPGDEVVVPAHTWISTASAVVQVGAWPVFCDTDSGTYLMNLDRLEALITRQTKAIIPVHFAGQMVDMERLMEIAHAHNLFVVEDCAQAHGAVLKGRHAGTWGDVGTFSFYPGKNLGAFGDAGAVITNSAMIFEKVRRLSNHGQVERHQHDLVGRNSRMDSIQAAVLSVKLKHLDNWTSARRNVANWYKKYLPVQVLPLYPENPFSHVYHLFIIQVPNRDALKRKLASEGIETSIHYPRPLNSLAFFFNGNLSSCPSAQLYVPHILSLPMFPELLEEEVEFISRKAALHLNSSF